MVDNTDEFDAGMPEIEDDFLKNADEGVKTITVSAVANSDEGLLGTFFFWFAAVTIVFMLGRYSDAICYNVRRFLSGTTAEDEEIQALKLSGGTDNSDVHFSLGEKIRDFAEASSESIKNTLSRGRDKFSAAAESMHNASDSRQRRGRPSQDSEDGSLTLLNDIDDGIDRLDGDDEKPFQSFAIQM